MASSLTVDVDGIGPVMFERSRRAKHIGISVKARRGVRVSVPLGVSFDKAMEFVHLKRPWIQKHLEIVKRNESVRSALAELSANIDMAKAKRRLTGRLYWLAKEHGFTYNRVSIRSQKTRWGSCSPNGNISLNVKLVLLPEDLMDYVILHELVHTRIHNHGKGFWAELDKYTRNGKAMASKLRKYGLSLL